MGNIPAIFKKEQKEIEPDFDEIEVAQAFQKVHGFSLADANPKQSRLPQKAKMFSDTFVEKHPQGAYLRAISKLYGSGHQALLSNCVSFFIGFGPLAIFGPTVPKSLSGFGKMALISTTAITGSIVRFPAGAMVDLYGGLISTIILLSAAVCGLAGLAALAAYTPTNYTVFSITYALKFAFGLLAGCGISRFPIGVANTAQHFPRKNAGKYINIFAGAGNLGPAFYSALIPVLMVNFGLVNAHIIVTLILLFGTIFVVGIYVPSFFHQLRNNGGLQEQNAKKCAQWLGQELIPNCNLPDNKMCNGECNTHPVTKYIRNTFDVLLLIRHFPNAVLTLDYICTFGGFLTLTATLPIYWREFHGLDKVYAGYLTMAYSAAASILRAVFGGPIDKYDYKSGGLISTIIGLTLNCIGLFPLAFAPSVEKYGMWWLPIPLFGEFFLAIGTALANAGSFKAIPFYAPDQVGKVGGLVGGIGATGGWIFPLLMGVFTLLAKLVYDGDEQQTDAWSYFMIIPVTVLAIIFNFILVFKGKAQKPLDNDAADADAKAPGHEDHKPTHEDIEMEATPSQSKEIDVKEVSLDSDGTDFV